MGDNRRIWGVVCQRSQVLVSGDDQTSTAALPTLTTRGQLLRCSPIKGLAFGFAFLNFFFPPGFSFF